MKASSIVCVAAALLLGARAWAEDFQPGVHYAQLPIPVDTTSPGKVEVVELFSYGCIHCYQFESTLANWRQAQGTDVAFRRVPAVFNEQFAYLAQVFYAAEALGVTDKVDAPLFAAIHNKQEDLRDPNLLAGIFTTSARVSGEELIKVLNSFSVRSRVQQADGYGRMYELTGVPALVVNGKYRVDGRMAGNNTRMLQVVDQLVERERQALPARATAQARSPDKAGTP